MKTAVRTTVFLLIATIAGLLATAAIPADAQGTFEVLYLCDCTANYDKVSYLFRVDLDSTTWRANLTPLPATPLPNGGIPLDRVGGIACTPDGSRLYCVDSYPSSGTGMLAYYDVTTAGWQLVGIIMEGGSIIRDIVLAGFSPGGVLYAASQYNNRLYTIDVSTAAPTQVGLIVKDTGGTLDVEGADLAFAADGTLYLWTNAAAPKGLYTLTLPATVPGNVIAHHLGPASVAEFFTGFAIRANGLGDLVGSTSVTSPNGGKIIVVDKVTGALGDQYTMYLGGLFYKYQYGDMSVGPLQLCTRTIGYWKNHSWDGAVVDICGVEINEDAGKMILSTARGKNFSMLIAQLMAARLNTSNFSPIPFIDDAEEWLCAQGVVQDGTLLYSKDFASKAQKATAMSYSDDLDGFNNEFECE